MAHRQACETKCIALEEDEEGAYWKSMGMAWKAVKPLTFWNVHLQRIVARNLFDIDMFELLCSEDTNRAKAGCFLMSRRLSRKPTFSHRSFDVPYYIILHHITILSPHCSRHTWKPLQSLILSMGLVQNRPPQRIRVNLLLQKLSRASEWQSQSKCSTAKIKQQQRVASSMFDHFTQIFGEVSCRLWVKFVFPSNSNFLLNACWSYCTLYMFLACNSQLWLRMQDA